MSLDHALLVSLLEKPSAGYELARRFDKSIGHFWHATHQQIYRVLARMETEGWVSAKLCAGETAPDRKEYSVTTQGRAELSAWLAEPSDPERLRSVLMVKLRGAVFNDLGDIRAEVARHLVRHEAMLDAYRAIDTRDFSEAAMPLESHPQRALQRQVLRFGITAETGWVDWCRETLALLDRLSSSPSPLSQESP